MNVFMDVFMNVFYGRYCERFYERFYLRFFMNAFLMNVFLMNVFLLNFRGWKSGFLQSIDNILADNYIYQCIVQITILSDLC